MKIHYIYHSGFCVELDAMTYLIFDYSKGTFPPLPREAVIYVFASHFHQDHFSLALFSMLQDHPNVSYFYGNDIKRHYNQRFFLNHGVTEAQYDRIHFLAADVAYTQDALSIETLRSTDSGVAFVVNCANVSLYHSGDLNIWSSEAAHQKLFYQELNKIKGRHFDAAFFPLDPHLPDSVYSLGFDAFMRATNTALIYPMHYWEDASIIDKLLAQEESTPYRSEIGRASCRERV